MAKIQPGEPGYNPDFPLLNDIGLTVEEVRFKLIKETPSQWPILLNDIAFRLNETKFKTLADFVTTSFLKGGLGIPLERAKELIYFNEGYKHKRGPLMDKLGILDEQDALLLVEVRQARNAEIVALYDGGKGMTQVELGKKFGLCQKSISNILVLFSQYCEKSTIPNQQQRATENEVSHYTQRKIDRIAAIDPDKAEQVRLKKLKADIALRQLGLMPSNLDVAKKAVGKLSLTEKGELIEYLNGLI